MRKLRTILGVLLWLCLCTPAAADVLTLEKAGYPALGLGGVEKLALSPDGRHLYTTSPRETFPAVDGPAIVVVERRAEGVLNYQQTYFEKATSNALCGAGQLAISPDGRNVYVVASCGNRVRAFARDETTGKITPLDSIAHDASRIDALANADAIALSPDGAHCYVVDQKASAIGVFQRDPSSGTLSWITGHDLVAFGGGDYVGQIAISPDGANLYLPVNRSGDDDDFLLVFARDAATGDVRPIEAAHDGIEQLTSLGDFLSVVLSPDGRYVYTGFGSDPESVVVVFRRDPDSGKLTVVQADPSPTRFSAGSLAMSPDGGLLFAGGGSRLTVLRRDRTTGRIAVAETHDNQPPAVDGLATISDLGMGVAVSPDGRDVYTASSSYGAIGHLRRFCGDGHIDLGEACDDGNGADGDGCSAVCAIEVCSSCAGEPSTCAPTDGASCDDGNPCTPGGACLAGVCTPGAPIADGVRCDDGDACTSGDRCVAGACRAESPRQCGACETCDRRFGCVGAPRVDCTEPPAVGPSGLLSISDTHAGRALRWRWTSKNAAEVDFGDPAFSTSYQLRVYDHFGLDTVVRRRRSVVAALSVPASGRCGRSACWHRKATGFRYRDASAASDGVTRLVLRQGKRGAPALQLDARGDRLDFRPLPLIRDVTTELDAVGGACWRADYVGYVDHNRARSFRGRAGVRPCRGHGC